MLDPILKTIEVPCSQEMAFDVFINKMDSWWPLGMFTVSAMNGAPAKGIRVEAKQGGAIVEIGADDTETQWGTIQTYQPHDYLGLYFHIPGPDGVVQDRTNVDVRFTELGAAQTRVELTQSGWEVLGEMAGGIREGYDKGWTMIFEKAYKAACSG